ncbi:hypothetical protein EIK77_010047 [Talaromyces pinophilus]|nr:hypothetical protein EIK77_010047 [Talaromyces pinophilus]
MVGNFASGYYASSTEIIYDSYEIGSKLGIYDKSRKSSVHYSEPRDWGEMNLTLTMHAPTHALLEKKDQNAQRYEITGISASSTLAD